MADVNLETPLQKDVIDMIGALDSYLASPYPASSNHLLAVESLTAENVQFVVARLAGKPAGCGALVLDKRGYGEIKRMYVVPGHRGLGIGKEILSELERLATEAGQAIVRLETGVKQEAALHLYRNAGYTQCAPFGNYGPDPLSIFMEKTLA